MKEGSCYLNAIRSATDAVEISEHTFNNRISICIWKKNLIIGETYIIVSLCIILLNSSWWLCLQCRHFCWIDLFFLMDKCRFITSAPSYSSRNLYLKILGHETPLKNSPANFSLQPFFFSFFALPILQSLILYALWHIISCLKWMNVSITKRQTLRLEKA